MKRLSLVLLSCLTLAFADEASELVLSHELEPGGPVLAVSEDGRYVVTNSALAALTVWDIQQGQIIALFEGHSSEEWWGTSVTEAILVADGWLISIAGGSGVAFTEGLIAQNIFTGTRLVLEAGNCDAIVSVPDGFIASCQQHLGHWQADQTGFHNVQTTELWLYNLIFDEPNMELWGLSLDPLSEPRLLVIDVPTFSIKHQFPSLAARLLGFDESGQLLMVRWGDSGDAVILERIDAAGNITLVAELASGALRLDGLELSPDGKFVIGAFSAETEDYQLLRLADTEVLADPTALKFAYTLSLHWHPQGMLSWTRASTYYHDLLRLWQPEARELVTNLSNYQVIYAEGNWQGFSPLDFEVFARPFYHPDAKELLRNMFADFESAEMLEFILDQRSSTDLVVTATLPVYDDSVTAYRYELGLRKLELHYAPVWALWEARYQWQCARGELAGEWTTEFCP